MFKVAAGGTFAGEKLASTETEPDKKTSLFGNTKPQSEGLFTNSQPLVSSSAGFG